MTALFIQPRKMQPTDAAVMTLSNFDFLSLL